MLESIRQALDRNGESCDIWYECPNCHCCLQPLSKFIPHVDYHFQSKSIYQPFQTPDRNMTDISQLEDAQLYIPKITLTSLNEAYDKYSKHFLKKLKVILPRLTEQDIHSIKSNLSMVDIRSRPRSQIGGGHQEMNTDPEGSSAQPKKISHRRSKKRKNRKPSAPCEVCGKILSSTEALKKHVARHNKKSKFPQCKICRKQFISEEELTAHSNFHKKMEEKRKLKTFECKVCKSRFMHKENLVRHLIKHTDNNPFRCKICGLNSISRYHLQRHYALHLDQEKHECSICGIRFSRIEAFRRHMINIHSVTSNPALQRKVRNHKNLLERIAAPSSFASTPQEVYVDQATGKIKIEDPPTSEKTLIQSTQSENSPTMAVNAVTLESLRGDTIHAISQLDPSLNYAKYTTSGVLNAFPCKLCPSVTFSRFFALRCHMKVTHPQEYANENEPKALSLICMECGQTCPSTQELSTHMETAHDKSLPSVIGPISEWIRCKECRCRCKGKTRLDRHMNVMHKSSGQPKHTCQICKKTYATVRLLRFHKTKFCNHGNEGGEKPKCPDCGKIVANKYSLKLHRRLHDPNRQLSICKLCNEQCSCAHSLKRHIRLVHGNGIYRPNKGKQREIPKAPQIPEDQLFL